MVMPLVDEHRPKCYLCHAGFAGITELRDHLKSEHGEGGTPRKEPAPGDVTVF